MKITKEYLSEKFGEKVYEAAEFARKSYPSYPEQPQKPFLSRTHTSRDAAIYGRGLMDYERKINEWKVRRDKYRDECNEIDVAVQDYIREVSGLNDIVPKQYQDKVYAIAYEDGHSAGYYEVYNKLSTLIEIFE